MLTPLVQQQCRRRPEVEMPEEMYEKLIGSPCNLSDRVGRPDMVIPLLRIGVEFDATTTTVSSGIA
jgi:hypothetical protein